MDHLDLIITYIIHLFFYNKEIFTNNYQDKRKIKQLDLYHIIILFVHHL